MTESRVQGSIRGYHLARTLHALFRSLLPTISDQQDQGEERRPTWAILFLHRLTRPGGR